MSDPWCLGDAKGREVSLGADVDEVNGGGSIAVVVGPGILEDIMESGRDAKASSLDEVSRVIWRVGFNPCRKV